MSEFDLKTNDDQPKKDEPKKPARDFEIDTKDNGAGKGGNLSKLTIVAAAVAGVAVLGYVGMSTLGGGASMQGPAHNEVLDEVFGGEGAFAEFMSDAKAVEKQQEESAAVWHPIVASEQEAELLAAAQRVANAEKIERFIEEVGESELDSTDAFFAAVDEKIIDDIRDWAGGAPASADTLDVVAEAYRKIVISQLDMLESISAERRLERISGVLALQDMATAWREADGILEEQVLVKQRALTVEQSLLASRDSVRDQAAAAIKAQLEKNDYLYEIARREADIYQPVLIEAWGSETVELTVFEPRSDSTELYTFEGKGGEKGEVIAWLPPFEGVFTSMPYGIRISGTCQNGEEFSEVGEVAIWRLNNPTEFHLANCLES